MVFADRCIGRLLIPIKSGMKENAATGDSISNELIALLFGNAARAIACRVKCSFLFLRGDFW